jgi:hypothetical protein
MRVALLPLVVSCGGSSGAGRADQSTDAGTIGCSGWYEQAGSDLLAHLSFSGRVRSVSVTVALKDQGPHRLPGWTSVAGGETSKTLRLPTDTSGSIVAASAQVRGPAHSRATCLLSNPH